MTKDNLSPKQLLRNLIKRLRDTERPSATLIGTARKTLADFAITQHEPKLAADLRRIFEKRLAEAIKGKPSDAMLNEWRAYTKDGTQLEPPPLSEEAFLAVLGQHVQDAGVILPFPLPQARAERG